MSQELSPQQEEKIRLDYFRRRVATCPFDDAILNIDVRPDKGVRPMWWFLARFADLTSTSCKDEKTCLSLDSGTGRDAPHAVLWC